MTTPKMPGTTPGSLGAAFTFSPTLLGASPAAAAAAAAAAAHLHHQHHHLLSKHRSPAPLNAGFSTPDALAAMGLGTGMGGMGLGMTPGMTPSTIPTILAPDETKKRELREMLRLLALRPGRISEEGVERLAKRMGLECYKDTDTDAATTTMSLGGKVFLLDIDFRGGSVARVALSFAHTPGPSTDLAALADEILLRDLSPGGEREDEREGEGEGEGNGRRRRKKKKTPLISPSLAPFAENLGRLAKSDWLSSLPHLNCFMAITGVYTSLLKVFEHEKAHLDGGELSALCKGNGRPQMHVRGKLGLSIDYWKARRFVPAENAEDGDDGDDDEDDDEPNSIWRVMVEVAEAPADYTLNPITPVRTSSHWVTDEIKKVCPDSLFGDSEDSVTDWLSPPLEELPDHLDPRPASSRFIARLDPPVAVPFQDELQLFTALLLAPPAGILADTLEALLFPGTSTAEHHRRVWVSPENNDDDDDDDDSVRHTYRLHAGLKPVYARHIHEVPFSHPKELPAIFAVLRQFVLVATLLRSCFGGPDDGGGGEQEEVVEQEQEEEEEDMDMDLDSFMASDVTEHSGVVPVDITAAEQPGGVFSVGAIFPLRAGVASFSVEVGRNADVRVLADGGESINVAALERAVEITEDLGLAVEWVRRR